MQGQGSQSAVMRNSAPERMPALAIQRVRASICGVVGLIITATHV